MKAYPSIDQENITCVTVRIRAEGDGIIGDLVHVIDPGDEWAGMTYDAWYQAAVDGAVVEIG